MPSFSIETEHYAGPLDALLDLIESRKLSISQVSMGEVCDAYLAYVEKLPELPLAETSQFILIASTLLLIKSRTLLPTVELSDEETQSIEELERRLAHYAAIRTIAKNMRKEWGAHQFLFPRRAPDPERVGRTIHAFNPGTLSLTSLVQRIRAVIATFPKPNTLAEATVAPVIALEDVVARISDRLRSGFRMRWSEMVRSASKHDAIVHFLAILELVRHGSVSASQDKLFSDILVESDMIGVPRY